MKLAFNLLLITALNASFLPGLASARQDIDSPERLDMLNQATGNNTAQNSFQRRVDAIMNIDTSANRDYVATRDEEARLIAQQQILEEEEAEKIRLNPPPILNPDASPKIGEKTEQNPLADGMERKMQDGTNKTFDQTTLAIYKNLDEKKKKEDEARQAAAGATTIQEETNPDDMLPSLANNPFYKGAGSGLSEEQEKFESDKNVIIQRMVSIRGFEEADARRIVRNTSSREELMINLMKEGYTYGESSDLADTASS